MVQREVVGVDVIENVVAEVVLPTVGGAEAAVGKDIFPIPSVAMMSDRRGSNVARMTSAEPNATMWRRSIVLRFFWNGSTS